jgi:hypothetical protein
LRATLPSVLVNFFVLPGRVAERPARLELPRELAARCRPRRPALDLPLELVRRVPELPELLVFRLLEPFVRWLRELLERLALDFDACAAWVLLAELFRRADGLASIHRQGRWFRPALNEE